MSEKSPIRPNGSILIICINYHSEKDTQDYIQNLLDQECSDLLRVIVVDNSERENLDDHLNNLAGSDSRISVLKPGQNLGYFGGAYWAVQQYLASVPLPDWVVVSNIDISFPDRNFFLNLFDFYSESAPAVLAPAIYSTCSGLDQNPCMTKRPSAIHMYFLKWITTHYYMCTAYLFLSLVKKRMRNLFYKIQLEKKEKNIPGRKQTHSIYAPHGSFILFHRSYFESGGNLNHGAFLFGEEIFVAETTRRLGLTINYDPRLVVIHREHAVISTLKNKRKFRFLNEAYTYCINEFFKKPEHLSKGQGWKKMRREDRQE